jgi:hypothetical protein
MKSIRAKFAAVVVAAAALSVAPAAGAFAATYPPTTPTPTPTPVVVNAPQTIAPGGSGTFTFDDFDPGEQVTFTLTGENAQGATLAVVKTVVNSKSLVKTADASGAAAVTVTLPSNASGSYTLAAVGASSGSAPSVTFSVAGGSGLPATGIDAASMTGVWIGGGALLAAGIAVTSVAVIRRRQAEQV